MTLLTIAAFATALGATGCSKVGTARSDFAHEFSCPEDRVTVHERTGPPPPIPTPAPPADVAADPQRLAMWKADTDKRIAAAMKEASAQDVYVAEGCGHTASYTCYVWSPGENESGATHVMCDRQGNGSPVVVVIPQQ